MDVRDVQSEGVQDDLIDGVLVVESLLQLLINVHLLLAKGWIDLGWSIILSLLLLTLLLLASLLSLLFLAALTLDLLLEDDVDGDLVVFLEVAGHRNLNNGWIVLQIEQETIQVHIDGPCSVVEVDQVLLHFTDPANGGLKHLLDEDSLLWVHNLVITLLKFAVNLNVLDVQDGVMGPLFLNTPQITILHDTKDQW